MPGSNRMTSIVSCVAGSSLLNRVVLCGAVLAMCKLAVAYIDPPAEKAEPVVVVDAEEEELKPGTVACGNLVYGSGKTSVCYSPQFLADVGKQTNIVTQSRFSPVKLESPRLYQYPFAVWTGEGGFALTPEQRTNLRNYLTNGGFIVASSGCSSPEWIDSCRRELSATFPELRLNRIDFTHPLFHTVNNITRLECRQEKNTVLEGLEIDGRIVLVFSADGLNDTANAGSKSCCCCGGNEIRNARQINVNLLAYALTH